MLTVSPVTRPSSGPVVAWTTSPVLTPTRSCRVCGCIPRRASSCSSAPISASPARTARSASSSRDAGCPEHGHRRVTDELLDHAPVALDRLAGGGEVGVLDGRHVLRVELLGQRGEADEVGEENADDATLDRGSHGSGLGCLGHGWNCTGGGKGSALRPGGPSVAGRLSEVARPVHLDAHLKHRTGEPQVTGRDSTTTVEEPTTGSSFDTETAETDPLVEAGQQATASAGHLAERAADVGIQQADHGRELAAEGIDKVARAVRRLSTDMEADQPQIAGAALTAADQADKVARYLRETDARQIIGNVEDAARKAPLVFLGGAFLLGMAASRFIKAAGGGSQKPSHAGYSAAYRSGASSDLRGSNYEAIGPGATANGNERF